MHPKSEHFHEISTFLESRQGASRKLLGYVGSVLECLRVSRGDFWISLKLDKNVEKSEIFRDFRDFSRFSRLLVYSCLYVFRFQLCRVTYPWYRAGWRALRVNPRGKRGWRFTVRTKCTRQVTFFHEILSSGKNFRSISVEIDFRKALFMLKNGYFWIFLKENT